MLFNFTAVSPYLPPEERALLLSQPAKKWIEILKDCYLPQVKGKKKKELQKKNPDYKASYIQALLDLANGIIRTKWTASPEAKKILEKVTKKKLNDIPAKLQSEFIKIRRVVEASGVILPNSLPNLGSSCWMNTLLQHFRSTHDFDALTTAAVNPRFTGNDAVQLTALQQKLATVVQEMRASGYVKEADLKALADLFKTCNIPPRDANGQQDATLVLDLMCDRFGPLPATIQKRRCRAGADDVQEPAAHFIPLRTTANGQTTTQMLTAELCSHQVELRNAEKVIEQVRYDYKISAPVCLQMRINRVGDNNPVVEQNLNIRLFAFVDQDEAYALGRVMCSTYGKKFGTEKDSTTYESKSGHYYYYEKVGGEWVKYNDNVVTRPTAAEVQMDFDRNAYALFYYKG